MIPLATLIQLTPDSIAHAWLDTITAIMVEAGIKEVTLPAAESYTERLCIMDRETIGLSTGYDIHCCANSETAYALGDSLHENFIKGLN